MTLLLDTHVFLWWLDDPKQLFEAARKAIANGRNVVYISAAVAWEIAIKQSLGKLEAPDDLEDAIRANRFLPLPVTLAHALAVRALPHHHRDPFDRLLIAQARAEGLRFVSRDTNVQKHGVPLTSLHDKTSAQLGRITLPSGEPDIHRSAHSSQSFPIAPDSQSSV
jgi:PIN domain nuclease of toxin-antitoxin system